MKHRDFVHPPQHAHNHIIALITITYLTVMKLVRLPSVSQSKIYYFIDWSRELLLAKDIMLTYSFKPIT